MRCFAAIELSDEVRRKLAAEIEGLKAVDPRLKWVPPENLHMTLKFLGDLEEAAVASLRQRLATVAARFAPFRIAVRGLGTFPGGRARTLKVVWAGTAGELDTLRTLQAAVERCAREVGVPKEEREFSPHFTLARAKDPRGHGELFRRLERGAAREFGELHVREVSLIQSTLRPTGPIYSTVCTFPLGRSRPGESPAGGEFDALPVS